MTPQQYRSMIDRAIESGNNELLDSACVTLAKCEEAKGYLFQLGLGAASDDIDTMVKRLVEMIK